MKERTIVREVLEQVATLPTQHEQHEYLSEAVNEDKQHVEDQFSNPDSLLLKLNEVCKKGELEWFSLPPSLIPSDTDNGGGTGRCGYSRPFGRASHRSPSTAKGYERPAWEEVEERVAFISSTDGKIECLGNFLAYDKEHIDESLLARLEAEQEPGRVPFRVKLRLGLAYLRACEKKGIPPLLKVSTIARNPHDALLPSSTSEECREASIALAEEVRGRVCREVAQEALQELRRKHEKSQSASEWQHELDRLCRRAGDLFCGEALLDLSEGYRRHDERPSSTGLGNTGSQQTPTEKDKRTEKVEREAETVFRGKSRAAGEIAPTRRTKVRVVVAHRISQLLDVSIEKKEDLNRLLSEFIRWNEGKRVKRPADAVWDAIGYAPGQGRGDIEEALERLHKRVGRFEKELGERVVENLEKVVERWRDDASAQDKNG